MSTDAKRPPPAVGHVLLALAIQAAGAAVLALLHRWLPLAAFLAAGGGLVAVVFYASRERRQTEEQAGSNSIAPWRFLPRAARDIGWPLLAVASVTAVVAWFS